MTASPSIVRAEHVPVLLDEVVAGLATRAGDAVVDGTVGHGGHSAAIARSLGGDVRLFCFDLDEDAIERAQASVAETGCKDARFFVANFRDAKAILEQEGIRTIDRGLLDLGLRSAQLEASGRGFSFKLDEPLLMTFSRDPAPDAILARDIVNGWEEEDIANAIFGYGGERYSRRIARAIVDARRARPIETTGELAAIIEASVPAAYRRGRIHPATKTFQALRIAVNDELSALEEGLASLWSMLAPGGRLAVISFHSLEDGIVKRFSRACVKSGEAKAITKKPLTAGDAERVSNPRARSAKLRIIERIIPAEKS